MQIYKTLFFLPLFLIFSTTRSRFIDLSKLNQEQYQDILINGKLYKKGVRDCQKRYEALKPILDRYSRPITVLDIGASQGYFSFKIAQDYDATCVMIEGNYSEAWKIADQLEELCKLNSTLDTIIFLKTKISVEELKRLSECEHFDVVLAFNVIHHFGDEWKEAAQAILELGDNVIVETPPPDDSIAEGNPKIQMIDTFLKEKKGKLIAEVPRHTSETNGRMYWIEQKKHELKRKYWSFADTHQDKLIIDSTYSSKSLHHKEKNTITTWEKGINLCTFKNLHGCIPNNKLICKEIIKASKNKSNDFTLWNFIIQGNKIKHIDYDDDRWTLNQKKCLSELLKVFPFKKTKNENTLLDAYLKEIFNPV